MKRRLAGAGVGLGALVVYGLAWPVPIDPAAWTPPEAPALTGPYEVNDALASVERLCPEKCVGSEDVAVATDGRIYVGTKDGLILRLEADGSGATELAKTGGHPLGLQFDPDGHLVIADAGKGLLRMNVDSGALETLATQHDGVPFLFTDDVDVGADGTVYFTDASSKYRQDEYRLDIMEHRPNGRLLAWDPTTKKTRLLLGNLHFANGVALAPDETFVLVVETGEYRIHKVWLQGPAAGSSEVLIENLPGLPDGISTGTNGRFWIALFTVRNAQLDALLPRPFLRKVVLRLPAFVQPQPHPYGFVLAIDAEGSVVHNLQDASPDAFSPVTSVQEFGGWLYLGSLTARGIARLPVPASDYFR